MKQRTLMVSNSEFFTESPIRTASYKCYLRARLVARPPASVGLSELAHYRDLLYTLSVHRIKGAIQTIDARRCVGNGAAAIVDAHLHVRLLAVIVSAGLTAGTAYPVLLYSALLI